MPVPEDHPSFLSAGDLLCGARGGVILVLGQGHELIGNVRVLRCDESTGTTLDDVRRDVQE